MVSLWVFPGLADADADSRPDAEVRCPRVHVPAICAGDLFDSFFVPIARDGASVVEVALQVQEMLAAVWRLGDPQFCGRTWVHFSSRLARLSSSASA